MTAADASLAYLDERLRDLEERLRRAVERHRRDDPLVDDKFRGLYISDAEVAALLALDGPPPRRFDPPGAEPGEPKTGEIRLRRLARHFQLDDVDVQLLLVALAPDIDPRFERLYAYLHDDVSRRRASTGLALELSGAPLLGRERRRLGPSSPLVEGGLVVVEETDRPFLTRSLRVPDRVTAYLVGDDTPDAVVAALLATPADANPMDDAPLLDGALRSGARLVYLREGRLGGGASVVAAALARHGGRMIALDLTRLGVESPLADVVARASREARLQDATLVAGPVEAIVDRGADALRTFAACGSPIVLVGSRTWDPAWSEVTPLVVTAPMAGRVDRGDLWARALDGAITSGLDVATSTMPFRLNPEQIVRAAHAARAQAAAAGRDVTADDLRAGARAQNAAGLERLARRIEPRVGWDDLVLPRHVLAQLHELVARVRQRDRVLDDWGMGSKSSKGRGVKALFAGESGTGKTMSAEVVAHSLGLDLYVIDLATVVDKYIGETEKNLDRIFSEADRVNGVLLFDEADALFGKRSEVKDAHDRYANVEVAYLLQRMEQFEGLAVLTTNLRSNLDDAFSRRLDAIVDFPMPEEEDRRHLWEIQLPPAVPRADDIDFAFLARAFKVSGGNIRNIALGAAYLAAERSVALGMEHLIRATEREYRKLGHLCLESEFGPYHGLVVTRTG